MKSIIYTPIVSLAYINSKQRYKILLSFLTTNISSNSIITSPSLITDSNSINKLPPKLIPSSIHYQQLFELLDNKPGLVINNTNENHSKYLADWTNSYRSPDSCIVCKPETVEEVSKILKYCNDNLIGVVPHGGNTGLCGGAAANGDQVIVSLEKMNKIIDIDEDAAVVTCEAGVILEKLNEAMDIRNLVVPLDLGSKGSCQIGTIILI